MADYDPKIIPTLDDIIDDDLDEEIKETVIDLSSLLTENDDEDDDNFDLFAAEVGVDDPAANTNNDEDSADDIALDITSENATTIEVGIEDDNPPIGAIDDIDTTEDHDTDTAEPDTALVADIELNDVSIELDTSIPDTTETESFSAEEALTDENDFDAPPEIDSEIRIDEIEHESEIGTIEPDSIEPDSGDTEETEPMVSTLDPVEPAESDLLTDPLSASPAIEKDTLITDEEEPLESALIDYHAEQENDVIIDTHREAQTDSSAEYTGEAVTEDSIEPKTTFDTEPATVSDTITEVAVGNIGEISLDPENTALEGAIDELPETALITENDATNNTENVVLASVTLEDLSENIIQQLMPELEQQLRFLVLKTLHEKLPAEITRQLSPNSAHDDNDEA